MPNEELVAESTLARLWRVYPRTFWQWRTQGRITSDVQERRAGPYPAHFYRTSTIDAIHARCGVGFTAKLPLPKVTTLLRQPQGLLTLKEAGDMLGEGYDSMSIKARAGIYPALHIKPGSVIRLPASLISIIAASDGEGLITTAVAAKVLCLSRRVTVGLVGTHLRGRAIRGRGNHFFIEQDSVLELLKTLLPPFITPEEWWQKTLQDTEPHMSIGALETKYHVARRTIRRLLADDATSLTFIKTVGRGKRQGHRVPAWAIREFLADEREPLPAHAIARLLAVDEATAATWATRHRLCSRSHGQAWHTCPSRHCLRVYIGQHAFGGISPQQWFEWCFDRGVEPVSIDELTATAVFTEREDVERAIQDGRLRGVWLPRINGQQQAAIARSDALAFQRAQDRAHWNDYHYPLTDEGTFL